MTVRLLIPALLLGLPVYATESDPPVLARELLLREVTSDLRFEWRVPVEVGLIPPLLRQMRAEAETELAKAREYAIQEKSEHSAAFPFINHEHEENWTIEADTRRLLSLGGKASIYMGGPHDVTRFKAIVWDKQAGRSIAFADLFTSWPKARAIITPIYCEALDQERLKKRGGKILDADDECPPIEQQAITLDGGGLGGSDADIDTIRVSIGPYAAGPYAEGSYILTVTLPDTVLALVRSAYRGDLAPSATNPDR